jgi:hypothetical protein
VADALLEKVARAIYASMPWGAPEGSVSREAFWDETPIATHQEAWPEGFAAAAAVLAVVDPGSLRAEVDRLQAGWARAFDLGIAHQARADAAVREVAALRAGAEYLLSIDADLHHQENASPDYWQGARDAHEWWTAKISALLDDTTPEADRG